MFASLPIRQFALAQMLLAVILSNMSPVFSKVLYARGWTPLILYFTTLIIVSIVLLVHEYIELESGGRWGMTRRDVFGVAVSTIAGGVLAPILFFTGLQAVEASEALILSSTLPFFVVVFGILMLKERFTKQTVIGSLFLLAGMIILLWPDIRSVQFGDGALFIIGSTLFGALSTITHKKYIVNRHLDSVVLVRTLLSALIVGCVILFVDPKSLHMLTASENIWLVLAIPILCFITPFFLFFGAIRKVKAIDVGLVEAAGRVFAIIAASTILGEHLTPLSFWSMTLVVFGILFINVPLTRWRIVPSRLLEIGPLRK